MTQKQLITEIKKERKRIRQNINRMQKRGYFFDELEIPKNEFTKTGKVSKRTLNKLKATTSNVLYEKARWIDTETGEILTGNERQKEEYHERAQKAAETRKKIKAPSYSIVDEILLRLSGFPDYLMKGTKGARGLRQHPIAQYRELAIQLVKDRMAEEDIIDLSEEYSNKEPLIAEKIMIIYQDSEGSLLVSHFTDLFALLSANGMIDTFYSTRLNDAIEEEFY